MLVDSAALVDASSCFEHGNQGAALVHETLRRRLSGSAAMAGDASIAEEFASAYDDAAASCLAAVSDLVDAFTTCGRITAACLANHGHAENRSLISGRTVFTGTPCVAGYVSVLACSLPSSLGGDHSGLPSWASWILDQVEGFVWPDADTDRLRAAAAAWRAASFEAADLSAYCSSAIRSFSLLRSPEVPVAVEVTSGLADRCRAVGDQCAVLARACDTYADHVDEQRAAILDLVHDLLRDAVIIQGVGIVLGTITGGATAAGAAALNAARIAAAAPRLLRIIATLRTLASTCAAPLRFAATALRDVRVRARGLPPGSPDRRLGVRRGAAGPRRTASRAAPGILASSIRTTCEGLSRKPMCEIAVQVGPCGRLAEARGSCTSIPCNNGRQIRVMDGYPQGSRPDPITEGPYAVVSQGNGRRSRFRCEGNPTL